MSARDPELAVLLRKLAAMRTDDREAVLHRLTADERARLRQAVGGPATAVPSPALSALIERCRAGGAGDLLTRRAADALIAAADTIAGATHGDTPDGDAVRPLSLAGRALSLLRRQG